MSKSIDSQGSKLLPPLEQGGTALLSLVVPVFNEEDNVGFFVEKIRNLFALEKHLEVEIVFVNDGSQDNTLKILLMLQKEYRPLRIVDLSRNFGKEAALSAGLHACKGDIVVPIDVDLQEPPEVILKMIEKWHEGFEVVLAKRSNRGSDSWLKKSTAKLFYRVHNWVAKPVIPENVGDFRLMDRKVVNALNELPESKRFMKGLFSWIGFRTTTIEFERKRRNSGDSKFNWFSLLGLAVDGFTSFSVAPLRFWGYLGCQIAVTSFIFVVIILVQFFMFGVKVPGYASLMVAITFLGGLQLIGIGVLGEYIGRIFIESKRRPVFVVRHTYEE